MAQTPHNPSTEHLTGVKYGLQKWCIEHSYAVFAFYLAIYLLAFVALRGGFPRRMMPYVEQPLVGVVTMMPGLSAEEMELYISKPIEEQLSNIEHLRYIRSTSQDGFSIVTLEFPYRTNMDRAYADVQALMNLVQSTLPMTGANLKPSFVLKIDPINLPVVSLSLTADNMDPVELREFADNTVQQRLRALDDIYSVVLFGGYRRQLQVVVDREKLAAYGLSILDVRSAVDQYNVSKAAGTVVSGDREEIIRVDTHALSAGDVASFPITRPGKSRSMARDKGNNYYEDHPQIIYVRDVAAVKDTYWERRSAYHHLSHEPGTQGKIIPAIAVEVVQTPSASSARTVPRVMKEVKHLEQEYPGVHFAVAYNNSHFIDILFENLVHELITAAILTAIAIFFFLAEWRGTLIATIVIPTSLAMALLGVWPMGFSLNSGTLIGLLLSVGRVVDDTIVDIHAVERHLRLGKDPKTATIEGIGEVRLAVIASTITIVLSLAPLLVCGGITQLMFVELVWPMIMALIGSTIASFTLNSVLCSMLLRHESERDKDLRFAPYRWVFQGLVVPFQRFLDWLEKGYARIIDWMLQHRYANIARILATVIAGFVFYNFIGSEMMPLADVGQGVGALEMEPGTSFAETEKAVYRIEQIMLESPEIEHVSVRIGTESMFETFTPVFTGYAMPQANGAMMMITLSDKGARKRTIWEVLDGVRARALAEIPGIRRLQIKEMGSDVMATAAAPVSVILYGKDLATLSQMGQELLRIGENMPDLFQPFTSWEMSKPVWQLEIDPARAAEVGLTPQSVAQQAYYATKGGLTDEWYRLPNIRQNTILVRYQAQDRASSSDLEDLYLTTPSGATVPLKNVAKVVLKRRPTLIEHDNLRRVVSVNGYYRIGHKPSMDVTMDLMMQGDMQLNFPPGYGLEARGDMTQMMDSFRRLLIGLGFSVFFVFLTLVIQFRGFVQPLQMVFSLPLELSGIFFALWLAGQAFSSVSIMAVIVVTGMDVTAAILLVDMIVQYRDRGVPRDLAVRTACPQRLRPILMTAISTGVVMVPVAFWPKTGLDAYQPLGTTVLGGLTIGTLLTLFDIPIMHTLVDDLRAWFYRKFLKKEYVWPVTIEMSLEDEAFIAEFNAEHPSMQGSDHAGE